MRAWILQYEGFVLNSLNAVLPVEIPFQEVALPVGISFYTFQILSYIIDVYWGNVPVQKNLMDFALYVTMFPQLIAGPIVKYAEIDEQLHVREENWGRFGEGVMYFIRGLAKKVLLANTVGMIYTNVSGMAPEDVSVVTAWLDVWLIPSRSISTSADIPIWRWALVKCLDLNSRGTLTIRISPRA